MGRFPMNTDIVPMNTDIVPRNTDIVPRNTDMPSLPHSRQQIDSNLKCLLRIDNSGWSVNSSALFDVAGMRWYQRKYHVLYTIRKPIINSIY